MMENGSRLSEPECYHQFCRLLAKLKCNYQLNELVDIEGYDTILDTIAKFTISSLEVRKFKGVLLCLVGYYHTSYIYTSKVRTGSFVCV